jgi:4-hydroxy 2-oxovalerate aldolase
MCAAEQKDAPQRWVSYRPDIKILDCTVRDGGLINDHKFDDAFVSTVYRTCAEAGVDYCEVGYKASQKVFARDKFGRWKFCEEDDLRRVIGEKSHSTKVSVMADADRCDYHTDILPREKSIIDCIRVACYIHQVPMAMEMVQDAHDKGYETTVQLMAVSVLDGHEILAALEETAHSPAGSVCIVDSYGALYSEQVRDLTRVYIKAMEGTGKDVGFHAHNNQQLAFANTVEALIAGASRLDATMSGIGRGAGNCPLELLIGFLHNPKFHLRPVLKTCRDLFVPLRREMHWGYSIPYALTGALNRHPRAAIEWHAGKTPDDFVAFYDSVIEEE